MEVPQRPDLPPPPAIVRHDLPAHAHQRTTEPRWWEVWKRPAHRDFSEPYRPPRWWQRVFSLASLALISLTGGIMAAVAIAAAVAAVAIALQSLVS